MKGVAVTIFCVLVCSTGAATINNKSGSPVEKVVELLNSLKDQIEQDAKEEARMYNKLACWCEKATTAKAAAIDRAQQQLRVLSQLILSLKGKVATLTSEIEQLTAEIAENIKAQEEATALRQKANAAYQAETSEMKQALKALEMGIKVLVQATNPTASTASLIQSKAQAAAAVSNVLEALPSQTSLSPDKISMLSDFSSNTYAPQSLTVQGILVDMYSTFAKDLESSTHTEARENADFEAFIAAKQEELANMKKMKTEKEAEKADAEAKLADASQNYDNTKEVMDADIQFFDETQAACSAKSDEWNLRKSLRAEELRGIKEAIEILSSDDARQLFSTSIKAGKETGMSDKYDTGVNIESFLQIKSDEFQNTPAGHAYELLKSQASNAKSLRLAQLAVQVRTAKAGHFDKVIEAIDTMVNTLKEEGAADIAKRDQCKEEYQKINSTISNVNWLIKNNVAKIDKLEGLIAAREKEREETIEAIATVTQQIADMEEQRIAENQAFLSAKKEDTDAIALLMEAREALSKYYGNHSIEMGPVQGNVKDVLLQQEPEFAVSNETMPDVTFSDKGVHAGKSKGIISILTMIIEDLNDEIKNGMKNEESTQLDFEKSLAAAKNLKSDLEDKKDTLETIIAKRNQELTDEHEDMTSNKADLEDEINYRTSIKPDCDFIIGAFEKRASQRTAEMNGLTKAKEFLVTGNFEASLMQNKNKFDDTRLSKIGFLGISK